MARFVFAQIYETKRKRAWVHQALCARSGCFRRLKQVPVVLRALFIHQHPGADSSKFPAKLARLDFEAVHFFAKVQVVLHQVRAQPVHIDGHGLQPDRIAVFRPQQLELPVYARAAFVAVQAAKPEKAAVEGGLNLAPAGVRIVRPLLPNALDRVLSQDAPDMPGLLAFAICVHCRYPPSVVCEMRTWKSCKALRLRSE